MLFSEVWPPLQILLSSEESLVIGRLCCPGAPSPPPVQQRVLGVANPKGGLERPHTSNVFLKTLDKVVMKSVASRHKHILNKQNGTHPHFEMTCMCT